MKILLVILLTSIAALAQQPVIQEKPDECSQANLLLAVQKAARQLPDDQLSGSLIFSGSTASYSYLQSVDRYEGKNYIERLRAIAADKEKEAKEARDLANREEARIEDIKLIKQLAKECARRN